MSQPQFLADHDLNEHIVEGVVRREPSVEFVRVRDVGLAEHPDSNVLEYAATEELIVISHDINTMPAEAHRRMLSQRPFAGLIMVHQASPVRSIIDDLVLIWSASELHEWRNLVCFLPLA